MVIGGHAGKPFIYDGEDNVVAVGGPRSGKGVGLVIPTLMHYHGSVVVHDVHGELFEATAKHRRNMGQKVVRFAPGEVGSVRFNPMDTIRFGTKHESDDIDNVAAAVCPPISHFEKCAFSIIVALLHHGISEQGRAFTLADAYSLSQRPGIVDELAHSTARVASETAKHLMRTSTNELSGIMSTVDRFLGVFGDASVAQATSSGSDFSLDDLQNGDTPVSLYLVSNSASAKRVIRVHQVLLTLAIRAGLSRVWKGHRDGWLDDYPTFTPPYKHKLLLLLDDYGRFERGVYGLSDALSLPTVQCGIQSFITVQNADQLRYPENLTARIRTCNTWIFLRPADMKTAEYISNFLPTVGVETADGTWGQRPWMTPDEIMQMTCADKTGFPCITFRSGNPAVLGEVVSFWMLSRQG